MRQLDIHDVAAYFGRCRRTIGRWMADSNLNFPRPQWIRGRLIWDESAIRAFAHSRSAAPPQAPPPPAEPPKPEPEPQAATVIGLKR